MNWIADDQATFGEGVARCARLDCCAPLRFVLGPTIVVLRCNMGHIVSLHPIVEPPQEAPHGGPWKGCW